VWVHWSWAAVAIVAIQSLPETYSSRLWNALIYLSVFAIVLLHEFGHALACRSVGGRANKIILLPVGGVALVDPPPRPGAVLWCLAAGPLVNLVLIPVTVGVFLVGAVLGLGAAWPDLHQYFRDIMFINLGLFVFNMLPIFPLDGGQMLQAILWFFIGRARSLLVVTAIGFVLGLAALTLTVSLGWYWLSIMAFIAVFFSVMGFRNARALLEMMQAPRREGVACPACHQAPPTGEYWRCGSCLVLFDVFEWDGTCPDCGRGQARMPCTACGKRTTYESWFPEVAVSDKPIEK
jgi:Zn-dependent protease